MREEMLAKRAGKQILRLVLLLALCVAVMQVRPVKAHARTRIDRVNLYTSPSGLTVDDLAPVYGAKVDTYYSLTYVSQKTAWLHNGSETPIHLYTSPASYVYIPVAANRSVGNFYFDDGTGGRYAPAGSYAWPSVYDAHTCCLDFTLQIDSTTDPNDQYEFNDTVNVYLNDVLWAQSYLIDNAAGTKTKKAFCKSINYTMVKTYTTASAEDASGSANVGYTAVPSFPVEITNTGSTTGLVYPTAELTAGSEYFTLSLTDEVNELYGFPAPVIGPGESNISYEVKPRRNLPAGTYIGIVTVSAENLNTPLTVSYMFTVNPTYTLRFSANGGSGTMASITQSDSDSFTIPENKFTAPEGKTFKEWNTNAEGKGAVCRVGAAVTFHTDTTLYAIWQDLPAQPETPNTENSLQNETDSPGSTTVETTESGVSPSNPVSLSAVTTQIAASADDKDLASSSYYLLQAVGKAKSQTSIRLSWNGVPNATKYVIYGNRCGKTKKYEKIKSTTKTYYTHKKLKKGKYYKYLIVAVSGKQAVAVSKTIHVATKGGTVGNTKKVTASASKLRLAVGNTAKIGAKTIPESEALAVKKHRSLAYESTDLSVVTVSKKGKITAVAKGTCYVYAYAQNGVSKKIKITVK